MRETLVQQSRRLREEQRLFDEEGIDILHLVSADGCKVSVNGQGHFPCNVHTEASVKEREIELGVSDEGDEDPDSLVGEEVEPDHDLDVSTFDAEPEETHAE